MIILHLVKHFDYKVENEPQEGESTIYYCDYNGIELKSSQCEVIVSCKCQEGELIKCQFQVKHIEIVDIFTRDIGISV